MAGKRRASLFAASALLLGAAAPETFEVTIWANDDSVERIPGVVSTGDHPCGATATVRLARMPLWTEDEGPLGTELVAEEGGDGTRWSVPVDYEPLAVRGSRLLVEHHGQRLWIGADGNLARDSGGDYPAPVPLACPAGGPFGDSAYAQCARLRDLGSGRERLIRYEAPCT